MTDEKEIVRRIKNSIKAKKSHADITRKLQQKGYKLEYIHALMKKATIRKKILITLLIILIVLASVSTAIYLLILNKEKIDLTNPLKGFTISFEDKATAVQQDNQSIETDEIYIEDIEITPDFLSYLLNEIGAWQLHKNPLTFKEPVINFKIDNQNFYSIIDGSIETGKGLSDEADMQFNTNKESIITAILSETPDAVFKEFIQSGDTEIEVIAGETELFMKGYLNLYDSLK
tara:strand:- start:2339 stop:3034 length:696 start_codon:yes stop_codon:yes gene_type:complete